MYPRSSVVSLKTSENWMRNMGRVVREGEQPMKMVKVRAGTVNRMREIEALKDDLKVAGYDNSTAGTPNSGPEVLQGLYAYSQTVPYIPEPVVNVSQFSCYLFSDDRNALHFYRARYRRTGLEISTCTSRQCYQKEQCTFHVRQIISSFVIEIQLTFHYPQTRVSRRLQENSDLTMLKLWYVSLLFF